MAPFEIRTEKDQDLTFIDFSGKVSPADVIDALKTFYQSEITANTLWNFSNCDVAPLSGNDFPSFIDAAKVYAHLRLNGKSAIVGPGDLAFGLGRMFTIRAELEGYPILNGIFRSTNQALHWLSS